MDERILAIYELIARLGVTVEHTDHLGPDEDGSYQHRSRLIRIRAGLSERPLRSTLAHECAHAFYGDEPSEFDAVNAKQERRADEWAALRLITPGEYGEAETRHDGNVEAMAVDLNVTVDLVEAFRCILLRLGDTVYVKPRFGAHQYHHRLS